MVLSARFHSSTLYVKFSEILLVLKYFFILQGFILFLGFHFEY